MTGCSLVDCIAWKLSRGVTFEAPADMMVAHARSPGRSPCFLASCPEVQITLVSCAQLTHTPTPAHIAVLYCLTRTQTSGIAGLETSLQSTERAMGFYDEIELEDMDWNEELQGFTYSCPCGDLFQITVVCSSGSSGGPASI